MDEKLIDQELKSDSYKKEWKRHEDMQRSFLSCTFFIFHNYGRDTNNHSKNFFIRVLEDITQSIISIEILAREGVRNTCRRELRYLIELSIKASYIVQQFSQSSYEEQILEFDKLLGSPNISSINKINFSLLGVLKSEFIAEVRRTYGLMSKYVHSTPHQLAERLTLAESGRTMGFEGLKELFELNDEVARVFALVIVMLFHSVPLWVVGDFFVPTDEEWYFSKSKYIAQIDSIFDYKHERKDNLVHIKQFREERIEF